VHYTVNIIFGNQSVPIHFLFETTAFFVGYRYYSYLRKHGDDLISSKNRFFILIGAAVGAFLGSHLIGIFENPTLIGRLGIIYFMGNKTIVGGLLGGLIGVELTKNKLGVTTSSGDLMVYPICLAMIIGRTGCFFAGLDDGTFGIASNLPWAIDFGDGINRHPTNLYEIVFWVVLWATLWLFERKRTFANGARFKCMMVSYLVFRFFIEFIKPVYFFSFGLSLIQLVCIAGILYYYKVFIYPQNLSKPKNHA